MERLEECWEWFNKKGKLAVLLCRCVPIVRSLISIPAGISKIEMTTFVCYTFIGSAIWNGILVYAGAAAGASWEKVPGTIEKYSSFVAIIVTVLFTVGTWKIIKKKLKG